MRRRGAGGASSGAVSQQPDQIDLASLRRAPVQEASTPPQQRSRTVTHTFWGHISVKNCRADKDGNMLTSRWPALSVTASINDSARRIHIKREIIVINENYH